MTQAEELAGQTDSTLDIQALRSRATWDTQRRVFRFPDGSTGGFRSSEDRDPIKDFINATYELVFVAEPEPD